VELTVVQVVSWPQQKLEGRSPPHWLRFGRPPHVSGARGKRREAFDVWRVDDKMKSRKRDMRESLGPARIAIVKN
jgi:hypothetical protein